jgi:uncharacterized protein YjiS (DUF1127 family)
MHLQVTFSRCRAHDTMQWPCEQSRVLVYPLTHNPSPGHPTSRLLVNDNCHIASWRPLTRARCQLRRLSTPSLRQLNLLRQARSTNSRVSSTNLKSVKRRVLSPLLRMPPMPTSTQFLHRSEHGTGAHTSPTGWPTLGLSQIGKLVSLVHDMPLCRRRRF